MANPSTPQFLVPILPYDYSCQNLSNAHHNLSMMWFFALLSSGLAGRREVYFQAMSQVMMHAAMVEVYDQIAITGYVVENS